MKKTLAAILAAAIAFSAMPVFALGTEIADNSAEMNEETTAEAVGDITEAVTEITTETATEISAEEMTETVTEAADGDTTETSTEIFTETSTENTTETVTSAETTTEAPTEMTTADTHFKDIAHRPWAKAAIENMASSGFISGRGNGIFAPDDGCTKADFTIVLVRMLGLDTMAPSGNFADVPADAYYYDYVSIARNNGLTVGVDGDNFHPTQYITREEIMAMVYNGLVLKGMDMNIKQSVLGSYSDGSLVSPQYRDAVSALLNMGAVQGTSATTIDPKSNVTRAQMAVLLNNIYTTVLK